MVTGRNFRDNRISLAWENDFQCGTNRKWRIESLARISCAGPEEVLEGGTGGDEEGGGGGEGEGNGTVIDTRFFVRPRKNPRPF